MNSQMMRVSSAMLAALACVYLTAAAADQPLGTVPLKDATETVIGSLSIVFKYGAGSDEVRMHATAVAIRDEFIKSPAGRS